MRKKCSKTLTIHQANSHWSFGTIFGRRAKENVVEAFIISDHTVHVFRRNQLQGGRVLGTSSASWPETFRVPHRGILEHRTSRYCIHWYVGVSYIFMFSYPRERRVFVYILRRRRQKSGAKEHWLVCSPPGKRDCLPYLASLDKFDQEALPSQIMRVVTDMRDRVFCADTLTDVLSFQTTCQ